ncbi:MULTISPECIES: pheST operon leader peptide PheM [Enterobacterales]|nr:MULTISPECIES: pheST operon leader peptide PheM [unclassified Pantoea]MCE0490748.1 pheST operon leader peptide PheM [Pantoea sp. Mb-10]MCE0500094.1 pheST operon leader peptide PheM [Pantoea sp. Pb-8]
MHAAVFRFFFYFSA